MLLGKGSGEVAKDQRYQGSAGKRAVLQSVTEGLTHGRRVSLSKGRRIKHERCRVKPFKPVIWGWRLRHERPPCGSRPSIRAEETAASSRSSSTDSTD